MSKHVECGQEHSVLEPCPLTGKSAQQENVEWLQKANEKNALSFDDIVYPPNSLALMQQMAEPRAPIAVRRKRKLERQNRRKGRA